MVELKNEMIESCSKKANVEGVKTEALSLQVESMLPERNLVLQNLLRAPRYFDLPKWSSSCSSSDEEYPAFARRRKKQTICHYCGDNHVTTNCEQIKRMFVISSKGNLVKRPDNFFGVDDDTSVLCLKCGATGHEMFSCRNGYDFIDLEEVRCYVCNENGHLCCANYRTEQDVSISCYSCGQSGHIGSECPKLKEVALCPNSELRDQSLQELCQENLMGSTSPDAAAPPRSGKTARRARNRKNKKAAMRLSMLNQSSVETNISNATQASPPNNVGPHDAEAGSNGVDSRNGQPVVYQAQLPPHFLNLWRGCPQSSGPHHLMRVAQALRNAPMSHQPPPPPMRPPTDSSTPRPDQGTHVFLPQTDSLLE